VVPIFIAFSVPASTATISHLVRIAARPYRIRSSQRHLRIDIAMKWQKTGNESCAVLRNTHVFISTAETRPLTMFYKADCVVNLRDQKNT